MKKKKKKKKKKIEREKENVVWWQAQVISCKSKCPTRVRKFLWAFKDDKKIKFLLLS